MIGPRWQGVMVLLGWLSACAPLLGCESGSSGVRAAPTNQGPHQRVAPARALDPDVVGPRLVRESFGPQLLFWLRTYRDEDGARVERTWTTASRGRVVTLRLRHRRRGQTSSSLTARWRIAVPLHRDLTPRQLRALSSPRGIVPANEAAMRMSSFPRIDPAHGPRSRPLALIAQLQEVDPREGRITVSIIPADAILDSVVTRRGRDLALLAGLTLIERARIPPETSLEIAHGARLAAGSRPLSSAGFAAALTGGRGAPVVLSWRRAGRLSLAQLLARPVDGIELLARTR